jgi:hypothetical protein
MKKVIALVLAAMVSLSMLGLLAGCGVGAGDIDKVVKGSQESNGVEYTNYTVRLKDSVDWAALSDADRAKLAEACFKEAQEKVAEDNVFNYNISGVTADGMTTFQFNAENKTLLIIVDNAPAGDPVPVEIPER